MGGCEWARWQTGKCTAHKREQLLLSSPAWCQVGAWALLPEPSICKKQKYLCYQKHLRLPKRWVILQPGPEICRTQLLTVAQTYGLLKIISHLGNGPQTKQRAEGVRQGSQPCLPFPRLDSPALLSLSGSYLALSPLHVSSHGILVGLP